MAGEITIYRMGTTPTSATAFTYITSTDKVDFDYVPQDNMGRMPGDAGYGTVVAEQPTNARAHVSHYNVQNARRRTDNAAPGQELARKPDTGFQGRTYTFNLVFEESDGTAAAIARLLDWSDTRQENSVYQNGRYGIEIFKRPEYRVRPSADAGLKITDFTIDQDRQHEDYLEALLVMELGGEPGEATG